MILTALQQYYRRLEADPTVDVVPAGYSRQKMTFRVTLKPDGTLVGIEPLGELKGKNRTPELMVVPGQGKPSGSGVNPCLLWDNAGYLLGYKPDDPKPDRTAETFAAFRDRTWSWNRRSTTPGSPPSAGSWSNWEPEGAGDRHPELADAATGFGVFSLAGDAEHVHERPAVRTGGRTN